MKGFWVVLGRELAAARLLLAASALFGLFVAVMPWLSGTSNAAEQRGAAALVGVTLWGLALALGLGPRAVAGPLGDRRLAFDFRQPLSPAAIWLGRLVAGALVVLAGAGLTLLVPLPFGLDLAGAAGALDLVVERALPGVQELDGLLALVPLGLVVVFLLAHTAGVAVAGPRAWLALDLAAVLAAPLGAWLAWRELGYWNAFDVRWRLLVAALALAVVGLFAATLAAARSGRSEPDRAHRAQAIALGLAALLAVVAALGYARWFTRPASAELLGDGLRPLTETWSIVQGRAPGRGRTLFTVLRATGSGRELRLGPPPVDAGWLRPSVQLSGDRSTLVWLERASPDSFAVDLWSLDLESGSAAPRRSPIRWTFQPTSWAVSPTGAEVAALRGGEREPVRLVRESMATGATLDRLPLSPCAWADGPLLYAAPERIGLACSSRAEGESEPRSRVFAVDLAARTLRTLGPIQLHPLDQGWLRLRERLESAP